MLGLDLRGHGGSDDSPTTFGLRETEDVAGALAWLGERGIRRVALVGSSMGGIIALASVAVLGDGRLASAPTSTPTPQRPRSTRPRPRIVAVVADSVAPELALVVGEPDARPVRPAIADRAFARMARSWWAATRVPTQPIAVVGLIEDVPLLLVHGRRDRTIPVKDARRLAAAAPAGTRTARIAGAGHTRGPRDRPRGVRGRGQVAACEAFARARGLGPCGALSGPLYWPHAPQTTGHRPAGRRGSSMGNEWRGRSSSSMTTPACSGSWSSRSSRRATRSSSPRTAPTRCGAGSRSRPSLILLDSHGRGLDGYEVADPDPRRRVRRPPRPDHHADERQGRAGQGPRAAGGRRRLPDQAVPPGRADRPDEEPDRPIRAAASRWSVGRRWAASTPTTARRAAWARRRSRSTRRSRSRSSAGASCLVDGNLQFGDHRVFLDLGLDRKSIVDLVSAPAMDADLVKSIVLSRTTPGWTCCSPRRRPRRPTS